MAVACAVLLLASGCTARASQEQYEERLERALQVRDEVLGQLDQRELVGEQQYDDAAAKLRSARQQLDEDAPPKPLEPAHEVLLDALSGLERLLDRLGRCEADPKATEQQLVACRQEIGQDAYDTIRNDFAEANTIYRQEGLSLAGLGGDGSQGEVNIGEGPEGGDEL